MPPPLLQIQDIRLSFGVMPLLSGATLAVAAGDRICLVGRNGSGKSTLLRIAAGLVQPDTGDDAGVHPRSGSPQSTIAAGEVWVAIGANRQITGLARTLGLRRQ